MKKTVLRILSFLMLFSLGACGQKEAATSQATPNNSATDENSTQTNNSNTSSNAKNTISYGITRAANGVFHPLLAVTSVDMNYNSIFYPSLLTINDQNELEPYFATNYEISDDDKIITYTLADNAFWFDEKPVTAEDIVFTFTMMSSDGFTGTGANDMDQIKGVAEYRAGTSDTISGLHAPDEHTFVVEFEVMFQKV